MAQKLMFILPFLALPVALSQPTAKPANNTIKWTKCSYNTKLPSECGTLTVPLDYSGEISNKTIELNMLKLKAFKQPSKGSILLNFGGPGNAGQTLLRQNEVVMTVMTGGHFDLIGIDPRGTGTTLPIDCFPAPIDRVTIGARISGSLSASDTALNTYWEYSKVYADNCYDQIKDFGRFIGTSSVATDFMQVVDALGEDGMLRYWGQSYGTVLGATLAVLFPDRIDRMVVDGVVNIHEYTFGWELHNLGVGEIALQKFLESCVKAGPEVCSLAQQGSNASEIFAKINELNEQSLRGPIVLGSNVTTDVIQAGDISNFMDTALRLTIDYSIYLSEYLNAIMDRNLTAYRALTASSASSEADSSSLVDLTLAVKYSDSTFRATEISEIKHLAEEVMSRSRLWGGSYVAGYAGSGAWRLDSKGRYVGDWRAKTKNPMLLVGSPYDLRTPYKSALNMSAGFEGSVVLQHNGLGHCVLYSPGQCAIKAVQNYFTNGTLPAPGTVCEQDFDVFSGKTSQDSFDLENL